MKMKSITPIILTVFMIIMPVSAGPWYPLCVAAACGITAVLGGTCCAMAFAACFSTCFSPYEQVLMMDGTYKNISNIMRDDKIHISTVISNNRIEGDFEFIEFTLSNGKFAEVVSTITVTSNNVMITKSDTTRSNLTHNNYIVKVASDVNVGDVMISDDSSRIIVIDTKSFKLKEKYTLVTENGLAIVSGVLNDHHMLGFDRR